MRCNYEIPLRAMLEFARPRQLSRQFCEKNCAFVYPGLWDIFLQFDAYSFPLIFFFSLFLRTNVDRQKNFDDTEKRIRVLKLIDLINEQDKK